MPKMRLLALSASLLTAALLWSTPALSREVPTLHFGSPLLGAGIETVIDEGSGGRAQATTALPSVKVVQALQRHLPDPTPMKKPTVVRYSAIPTSVQKRAVSQQPWRYDPHVSNYGGADDHGMFDGKRTACGQTFGPTLVGVAHKTLPCGTRVAFRYGSHTVIVRVVDRGPYVAGRQFDLTIAAARALHHVFTGGIYYQVIGR